MYYQFSYRHAPEVATQTAAPTYGMALSIILEAKRFAIRAAPVLAKPATGSPKNI